MNQVHEILHPKHWRKPKGYANGVMANGTSIFLGGQIGWNENEEFDAKDFAGQVEQCLRNIVTILEEANAGPEHLVRLTWFVTNKQEYLDNLPAVGAAYVRVLGKHFPAMSLVQVVALVEDAARVEIEATAVLPPFPAANNPQQLA